VLQTAVVFESLTQQEFVKIIVCGGGRKADFKF
jgi:aspartokinase-like uncharacterized kinase